MIKFFVDRPLFTTSIVCVIVLLGLYSLFNLPLDMMPKDIELPAMTVITAYPGASAEDIETTVTKNIEDAVSTVPNIERITSTSFENVSSVVVTFKYGSNLDAASADLRDKIELAKPGLPEDAQAPTVFKFDVSMIPVLYLGIIADESYKDLYQISDKIIGDSLKRVPGVGSVSVVGGLHRQINIDVDRSRLEAYHLSINQVISAIQASNVSVPAGSLKVGSLDYSIRVPAEYSSVEEVARTVVGNFLGRVVYLKDIARVSDSYKEAKGITRIGGVRGVMITVQKQSGTNTLKVAREAKKELAQIQSRLPRDVKIVEIYDSSEMILWSINNLKETLYWGFLFVVLTVYFFLREIRSSLIISSVIPVSLISAFIYLYFSGGTINILSLSAMVIAIGMVVDNAIVVFENIYRHHDEKQEPVREAAIFGTGEVAAAVTASTLTNLVVFVPIIMIQAFIAFFFRQLAFTTTVVMFASLFMAISLTPMLAARFLKIKRKNEKQLKFLKIFDEKIGGFLVNLEKNYKNVLDWALTNRKKVIIGSVLLIIFTLPLFKFIGTGFFPNMDFGTITGNVELPEGTRWEDTATIMEKIEKTMLTDIPELRYLLVRAGSEGGSDFMSHGGGLQSGSNYGLIISRLLPKSQRKRSTAQVRRMLTEKVLAIPGVKGISVEASEGPDRMAGITKPITIEIYGYDLDKTYLLAEKIKKAVEKIPGAIEIDISLKKGANEYWVKIDRAKAAVLCLSPAEIALALRNYFYGNAITKYREAGEEYDIFLRLKDENRKTLADLENIFITNRMGQNIALSNVASLTTKAAPLVIERKNQQRVVKVLGDVSGRPLGKVVEDIRKELIKIPVSRDITVKIAGSTEKMNEAFGQLFMALILGVILIYLVMVAQFESLLEPFIVMFSVPFALVGVAWAMFLTGSVFSVMPFVGMIMVVGVAVNNAIVLIDYTNILRARGMRLKEAVLASGPDRLRPILMTTIATIFGLVPMVLSRGEGAELWTALAIAIIGGLLVSAIFSLIFVPVVYTLVEEKFRKREYLGKVMQ